MWVGMWAAVTYTTILLCMAVFQGGDPRERTLVGRGRVVVVAAGAYAGGDARGLGGGGGDGVGGQRAWWAALVGSGPGPGPRARAQAGGRRAEYTRQRHVDRPLTASTPAHTTP